MRSKEYHPMKDTFRERRWLMLWTETQFISFVKGPYRYAYLWRLIEWGKSAREKHLSPLLEPKGLTCNLLAVSRSEGVLYVRQSTKDVLRPPRPKAGPLSFNTLFIALWQSYKKKGAKTQSADSLVILQLLFSRWYNLDSFLLVRCYSFTCKYSFWFQFGAYVLVRYFFFAQEWQLSAV